MACDFRYRDRADATVIYGVLGQGIGLGRSDSTGPMAWESARGSLR